MNIAFVTWFFPKISETFILNQIMALKSKGHNILIYSVKDPQVDLAKEDLEPETITHPQIKQQDLLKTVKYGLPDDLAKFISKDINAHKIDIIYFQFPDLASKILSKNKFKIPVATVFHDIPKIPKKVLLEKYQDTFNKSDLILAISEFTKNELIKLSCPKNKIVIHHMGVDLRLFRSKQKRKKQDFVFSMIGRFVEKKGFKYGLLAFRKLLDQNPNKKFKLNLVGGGLLEEQLKQLVVDLNLGSLVKFHGKLSQDEIVNIIHSSDILIVPSITALDGDREGLPVVLLEALACGVAVIATKHTAIPEVVSSNIGFLVRERSIIDLVNAMSRVVYDKNLKNRLEENGRKIINLEYNIESLVDRLVQIFKLICALNNFSKFIKKYLAKEIYSVLLTGSLARYEKVSEQSDVDIMIIFKKEGRFLANKLSLLRKGLRALEDEISLKIAPQIFNKKDLLQLVSPSLYKTYSIDGKRIYGQDIRKLFKKKAAELSNYEFDTSILKRILFNRYFLRQTFMNSKEDIGYILAKNVFFLAFYYLYIDKGLYLTERKELQNIWKKFYKDGVVALAIEAIEHKFQIKDKDIQKMIVFVEKKTDQVLRILESRYPDNKIYIKPF